MRLRTLAAGSAFAIGAGFAATAPAQIPPLTSEFQVNSYTTSDQFVYGVQLDSSGGFVVTWDSDGEDGSGFGAVARLFDETQTPATGDFAVNTYTTGTQDFARVAMDGSGRFVVAWASDGQDGSGYGVFARRFDRDGTPLSGEIPVNTYTTGRQAVPHVAADGAGNFVVVWTSYGQDGSLAGGFGRRFDRTGAPLGGEFAVNTATSGNQYVEGVSVDGTGNFVVVWTQLGGAPQGIFARRWDAAGNPLGGQFQVDTTAPYPAFARVASDRAGDFLVVWEGLPAPSRPDVGQPDIVGRLYDGSGAPVTGEVTLNQVATGSQLRAAVGMDHDGNFIVSWSGSDGDGFGVFARRFDRFANAVTDDFPVNAETIDQQLDSVVAANAAGDFAVAWNSKGQEGAGYGVFGRRSALTAYTGAEVDVDAPTMITSASDLNGVLEPGETVVVNPTWANRTGGGLAVSGTATDFSGPAGPTYAINLSFANYGTIAAGGTANCYDATGVCYVVTVSGSRPVPHWDAKLQEKLANGVPKTWSLHVGGSFPDVPSSNLFYRFIETLFHDGVTGGCAGGGYCPTNPITRAQMAVFLLKSKYGAAHVPPPCTGTVFGDVPCTGGPFDPWIEELAALQVTGGCGGGNYCPTATVTRKQMAVFLLKTLEGSTYDPPDCTGVFADVPCTSGTGFSDWIEELYARQITGGCSASPLDYCPDNPNNRGQMAVFLTKTFGLQLYGAD